MSQEDVYNPLVHIRIDLDDRRAIFNKLLLKRIRRYLQVSGTQVDFGVKDITARDLKIEIRKIFHKRLKFFW